MHGTCVGEIEAVRKPGNMGFSNCYQDVRRADALRHAGVREHILHGIPRPPSDHCRSCDWFEGARLK